jgi:glycosyltransferase involved in cell wall biosynthesis
MMQEQPLVSVVMVTYNSERYIKDAVESVLCQSYENLELIICDDASGDNTWNIIQQYKDGRIRACRNETNIGEYPNRNKGIGLSKGEYLIFIDGDDMIYPHGLEFMVKMLHAFPDCGMALMQWYRRNLFYPVVMTPGQLYTGVYLGYGFNDIAFANVLMRTAALKSIGGLTELFKNGDDHARLAIGATHNTLLINDNLTWWRETPGQASSKFKNNILGAIEHFRLRQLFLANPHCPLSEAEKVLAERNNKLSVAKTMRSLLLNGRLKDVFDLKKACHMSWNDCMLALSQQVKKDPFEGFTPENPVKVNLNKNPFARV